ncbi:MAG: prephenate dehydrogenase [Acholeplasmataceae bacterium]|jgi:prephenate dehydrogenase|nr:prephenate dehydrogenase [Acholeplasmataceae bacterium]
MKRQYFIVGLGMIGASYAKKLSELGHLVYGYDKSEKTNKLAVEKGYIKAFGKQYIKNSDLVILCLYPNDNYLFVKENIAYFKNVKLVTDVSGIKQELTIKLKNVLRDISDYISHHPMAGNERSGIEAVDETVFLGANFLIINDEISNHDSLNLLRELANYLGFNKISLIDSKTHDLLISFTSQLPHVIAVSLVNSDIFKETKYFTGDSYKDLTRIAKINYNLWTELFLANKENLISQMERFKENFEKLLTTIKEEDKLQLEFLLKEAKEKRENY